MFNQNEQTQNYPHNHKQQKKKKEKKKKYDFSNAVQAPHTTIHRNTGTLASEGLHPEWREIIRSLVRST
jgi:hypothetical protein